MKKEELIAIRRDLHRIPELGFQEFKTQQYLLHVLEQYPQDRIEIEKWRTGLFVKVNGTAAGKNAGVQSGYRCAFYRRANWSSIRIRASRQHARLRSRFAYDDCTRHY
nr:hypothetical protein P5659_18645 [Bacillus subtilis]